MNSPKVIADILFNASKERGFLISDMLRSCELSGNTLSNMRKGSAPRYDSLAKMAEYAGYSLDYLVGIEQNHTQTIAYGNVTGNNSGNAGNTNCSFGGSAPSASKEAAAIGELLDQLPLREKTRALCEIFDILDKYKPNDSE